MYTNYLIIFSLFITILLHLLILKYRRKGGTKKKKTGDDFSNDYMSEKRGARMRGTGRQTKVVEESPLKTKRSLKKGGNGSKTNSRQKPQAPSGKKSTRVRFAKK